MSKDNLFEVTCRCGEKTMIMAKLYKRTFCGKCGAEIISWKPSYDALLSRLPQMEERILLWEGET